MCISLTKQGNRCKKSGKETCCNQHLLNHSINSHSEDDLYDNPTEIVPGLFLGSESKVCNGVWLKKYNIKTVVNATDDLMCEYKSPIKFYMWNMQDRPSENIIPFLEKTAKIIDFSLSKKEGILIHCHMGISRSASLVWYWLSTRKYNGDYKAALNYLRIKRWIVNPNSGFKKQVINEINKKFYRMEK